MDKDDQVCKECGHSIFVACTTTDPLAQDRQTEIGVLVAKCEHCDLKRKHGDMINKIRQLKTILRELTEAAV